jgi:hypothetical protein
VAEVLTKKQPPWGGIALIIIVISFCAWLATHLEWKDETTRSGFSGEALHNPYYAGMLLLTQSGYTARRLDDASALDGLSTHSTLLLNSPELFNNRSQVAKLLDWIERGGHLVLPLGRGNAPDNLLRALGVQIVGWNENSSPQQIINIEHAALRADLRDAPIFDVATPTELDAMLLGYFNRAQANAFTGGTDADAKDDADGTPTPQAFHTDIPTTAQKHRREAHAVYARWKLGQGHVTAGSLRQFNNGNIDDNDHAELFVRLMSLPLEPRSVYIALTAEYPGLATWLIQHAGEALIALALLLTALLWRAMPRFGPLRPERAPKRPGLLEHISATGDFLLREKQYEALIAPLREDVVIRLTNLRSRHPEIASLQELGAHIAHLDVHEVSQALTPSPTDAHDFQRRSRTLATLREHCTSMQNTFSPEGS